MEKDRFWRARVCRYPFTSSNTPERNEENEVLKKAGYYSPHPIFRGTTQHETQEQAEAAALEMVRKVQNLNPTMEWVAFVMYSVYPPEKRHDT